MIRQRTAPTLASARRTALSLLVWWAGCTAALWLLGALLDGPPSSLAACAASAALLLAVGEAGHLLRRRFARGRGRSTPR
ncbi:hypothetical protein ACWEV4_16675 [Streptomyces sp. NPDC003860]